jgi:hypothetical protein
MSYDPDKLSMEKVASAFTPEDRIGALEMQNLSVTDNRALLLHHLRPAAMSVSAVVGEACMGAQMPTIHVSAQPRVRRRQRRRSLVE